MLVIAGILLEFPSNEFSGTQVTFGPRTCFYGPTWSHRVVFSFALSVGVVLLKKPDYPWQLCNNSPRALSNNSFQPRVSPRFFFPGRGLRSQWTMPRLWTKASPANIRLQWVYGHLDGQLAWIIELSVTSSLTQNDETKTLYHFVICKYQSCTPVTAGFVRRHFHTSPGTPGRKTANRKAFWTSQQLELVQLDVVRFLAASRSEPKEIKGKKSTAESCRNRWGMECQNSVFGWKTKEFQIGFLSLQRHDGLWGYWMSWTFQQISS